MDKLPKSLPAFFWHFIKGQWKAILGIQFFAFGWALDHTLWPYIIMLFIDTLTAFSGDRSEIWTALSLPIIMAISLWVFVELSYRLSGFITAYTIPRLEASVRMEMFNYVQHHAYVYFSNRFSGNIATKISEMPQNFTKILEKVVLIYLPVLLAVIISTTLFIRLHFLYGLILTAWFFFHLSICYYFSKKSVEYSNVHAESRSSLTGKIVDSLSNHLNVKLFARHTAEVDYINQYQLDEKNNHIQALVYLEKMKIVLGIVSILVTCIGINWLMIRNWQRGEISTGEAVFIFNTSWNMTMMVWFAGLEFPGTVREIGVCQQALTIIQDSHDVVDKPNAKPLIISKGEIIFDNVSFHYDKTERIFENKTLTIAAGEKVGLVGFSGSGKTTFVHLILRYFDVELGHILIDGQDIADVTQDSLRSQIAMIPQEPVLFHRTLMENIRYGRPNATDEEVFEASKRAHCQEFIDEMPEGYNTLVGERGLKISGGQRQRIAIARAILKNAPIIILDEATSALDSVTEGFIQESLDELMQGRTTIVIAHRLSTLRGMDRILVFKWGEIVEEGTHESLLNLGGHYGQMWDLQAGGFLPEE